MLIFIRSPVRPVQVCLELSFFIFLAQIFKQSVSSPSMSTQSIKIRVNTVGAFKYCVLFSQSLLVVRQLVSWLFRPIFSDYPQD